MTIVKPICVIDIETESLTPSIIHCIVTKELGEEPRVWTQPYDDFIEYTSRGFTWVAHNGLAFDFPVLGKLLGLVIRPEESIDTFVVSRLVNYSRYNTHSLDELGKSFGVLKGNHTDWSKLSQEMIDYCIQDVLVTEKVYQMYKKYIHDPDWQKSMRIEHDMVVIGEDMRTNGFKFDSEKAKEILQEINERKSLLEVEFQQVWPPWLEEVNRVQYRMKLDGTLYSTTERAIQQYPKVELHGNEVVCYDYHTFNPGSTKDRIDKLWEAGWKPTERTKGGYKFDRLKPGEKWGKDSLTREVYLEKKEYYAKYGWTVSEENLETLSDDAPEGAKKIAEWLTLEGRRSSLEEWLGCVQEDGRIHGKFWHIGAWTHRMSHSAPNSANISSAFQGEVDTKVKEVKNEFDARLRALWCTDRLLVGVDAESIQLRILAHYLRNDDYVHAIVSGRKEDATDIHNLNLRSLGLGHLVRDDAKTFIYAWLLGAGTAKVSRILRTSMGSAKTAVGNFIENTTGLGALKSGRIKRDAQRGWFEGLDGRKVLCNSDHLMLAGYLQNGEACIMKHANRLWREWADKEKILYKQVNFVHDEWVTECLGDHSMAEHLGKLQQDAIEQTGKELGVYCPLAGGAPAIGLNWMEIH
jgi:DNA polymerase-1